MNCTVCSSNKHTIAYYGRIRGAESATILSCSDCGVSYLKDMQEVDYKSGYRETVGPDELVRHVAGIMSVATASDAIAGKFVIDIGCSAGTYLNGISHFAKKVAGVEPNEEQRKLLDFECFESVAEAILKHEGKVDTVTMWHVIEHIAKPVEFLTEVKKLLTDTGRIYLSTPNTGGLMMDLLDEYQQFFYRAWHTHYYDTKSLFNLGNISGLEPLLCVNRQSFGIGSALSWLRDRKPLGNGIELPYKDSIDFAWRLYLEHYGKGDTLYMVLSKEKIH